MADQKPKRGGKQPGAGRPRVAEKAKPHTINLIQADWDLFRALGGVKWLRRIIHGEK